MAIGWGVLVRGLLFVFAIVLCCASVTLLVYGGYATLVPYWGAGEAALISALGCLAAGSFLLVALVSRNPKIQQPLPVETPVVQGGSLIKALTELAQDHPLMAVCCAAILGATNGAAGTKHR